MQMLPYGKSQLVKWILMVFLAVISTGRPIGAASDLSAKKEALDVIADFAERLCKDIPLEGSGESIELSGEARAELNGLIKKLADLGIQGIGKYQKSYYEGILRSDLAEVLKSRTECRLEIFRKLEDKFFVSTRTPDGEKKDSNTPSSTLLNLQEDKPTLLFNDQLMITLVSINRTAIPPHIKIEISGSHIKNTHQIKLGSRMSFSFNNKNYFIDVFEINNSSAKISVTKIM